MTPTATFAQHSSPAVASAVAVFEVAGDVDAACRALGFVAPAIGACVLRAVPGVDTLLAIRPNETTLLLTPHGGVRVGRALSRALLDTGLTRSEMDPAWPDASSDIEARMLTALGHARGERAVALLLDQPRRWAGRGVPGRPSDPLPIAHCPLPLYGNGQWATGNGPEVPDHIARELARLLHPPLVVATGPANVGKSSLVNALAGRTVARVADRPGVTRDAVAVDLELDGLVVRWLDAPGVDLLEGDGVLAAAQELARRAMAAAELVIWCADASSPPPLPAGEVAASSPSEGVLERATTAESMLNTHERPKTPTAAEALGTSPAGSGGGGRITIATRADLHPGGDPPWADAAVSTVTGRGLEALARLVRQRLVSDAALEHPGAWGYWGAWGATPLRAAMQPLDRRSGVATAMRGI